MSYSDIEIKAIFLKRHIGLIKRIFEKKPDKKVMRKTDEYVENIFSANFALFLTMIIPFILHAKSVRVSFIN